MEKILTITITITIIITMDIQEMTQLHHTCDYKVFIEYMRVFGITEIQEIKKIGGIVEYKIDGKTVVATFQNGVMTMRIA